MSKNMVTATQIIGGGVSAFGAMSDLESSRAKADAYKMKADETRFATDIERSNAREATNDIRQQLIDILDNNAAALSTAGIDSGSGSALRIQQNEISKSNRAIRSTNTESKIQRAALKRKAENLDATAKHINRQAKRAGKLKIINMWTKFVSMGAA